MRSLVFSFALAAACGGAKPPATPPPGDPPASVVDAAVEPAPVVDAAPVAEPTPPDPAAIKAELMAKELAAFEAARPVFEEWCAKCHAKTGKQQSAKKRHHFDMTSYPFGGHHAAEISTEIRTSLAIGGGRPTMPADKKGAVQGEELALVAAWADAFDAAQAGGAHATGGEHHHH